MSEATTGQPKNGLSDYALTLDDMVVGRAIVRYHVEKGVLDDGVIVHGPLRIGRDLTVIVENSRGERAIRFLSDIGVMPYRNGKFSDVSYTIDAADRCHLPRSIPASTPRQTDDRPFIYDHRGMIVGYRGQQA